ncbi:MAG: hypothetical protein M1546_19135 [Chloroflexi bacterium]|nr:hypothetical protein [Chloroflexota bacterium]
MEPNKTIGSVNVLDLRNATEASIAPIKQISSANVVIYTPQKADLMTRLNLGSINMAISVPADASVQNVMGQVVINRDYFKNQTAQVYLVVMGQVMVEPDVPGEDIEKGLGGVAVMGQLICPEPLMGVVQSKVQQIMGQTITYPPLARTHIGSLTLDERYLNALADQTELAVVGALIAPQVLPNNLLEQKLKKLFVSGEIRCHEENAQAIQARLANGSGKIKAIPAGYEWVMKPLVLDNALLAALPARKLYCSERVQIDAEVEPATLDKSLEGIACEAMILCPESLRRVLTQKCNLLETQVVFYEGELLLVEGEFHLRASRFNSLQSKVTLVVFGELTLAPEITAQALKERLVKVHNLGQIKCTPDQMDVIEARLGIRDGELQDSTLPEEASEAKQEGELAIGSVNYLAL